MDRATLTTTLTDSFDGLSPQLREAARWVLDHPADVALLTTREQAKRAGLTPATFTRLAQRIGFEGYEQVRRIHADSVRERPDSFRGRAEELLARREAEGDAALVQDTFATLAGHLHGLSEPEAIERFTAAAERIAAAERVFCLGLRSGFVVAYMFHYVRSLFGAASVLVDGAGGTGTDILRAIGPADVLLAVTVKPYTRLTVEAAADARRHGAAVVALTDSAVSPLALEADEVVLIGTETPSFFHTMAPALAAVECLAFLVATRRGPAALSALAASEDHLAAFDTYLMPSTKRRTRR